MQKIIHFTVPEPKKLSSIQVDVIERARKLHPNWDVRVWGDPVHNAEETFPLEKYWAKANSGAQLADLWRLDLVYKFGGVFIDSDMKLFKPLDDLVNKFDFFISTENGEQLTNAIFGARTQSPIVRLLIDELLQNEPDWKLPANLTTGPHFFSQHLKWRKDITILPRESFYTYAAFYDGVKKTHRHSYGEHLWAYSWESDIPGSPVRPKKINRATRAWHSVKRTIKKPLKRSAVFAFKSWHRLQSLDPMRIPPGGPQRSYPCSGELVVQTIHGHKIVVDGHDISLTPELVFNGFYEFAEQSFLKNTVVGGDWVIDVGANVGTFSLLAAQLVGSFGRVFAFEPNARASALMAKSLVLNWMHERVVQVPMAVGDVRGTVKLTFTSDRLGDGKIEPGAESGSAFGETLKILGEEAKTLSVNSTRLDDEFPLDLPIKVLKIDAEGYEGCVLAGADRLLRSRCVDFILMELLPEVSGSRWHETVKQVNSLISYGYVICCLTKDGEIVEQKNLAMALKTGYRNIVLAAQDQYKSA
jgi:FkbM family methyltransferase